MLQDVLHFDPKFAWEGVVERHGEELFSEDPLHIQIMA